MNSENNRQEYHHSDDWNIAYTQWNSDEHPLREALCTLGNGYFATRAAMEELPAGKFNYPGTYLAGGYNRAVSKIKDKEIENEDLVNWPNWLHLRFKIKDGDWFDIEGTEVLDYSLNLNLQEGVLERKLRFRDEESRETSIVSRRIVCMHDPHVAAIEWSIIPENWNGMITIRSGIDGSVKNEGVARYSELNGSHLDIIEAGCLNKKYIYLTSQSKQSKIRMTQAAMLKVSLEDNEIEVSPEDTVEDDVVYQEFRVECERLQTLKVEKLVTLYSSKDNAISDTFSEATSKVDKLVSFSQLYHEHRIAWSNIWSLSNLELKTSGNEIQILRLHIFHLHQTVSDNSIGKDIGVPSRGWHGEAYRGHIFWDELYIFPFINFHAPQLARSLLMYRYYRLPKAKEAASEMGYRGAMYPWQSGSNGREESQSLHLNPQSGRWIPDNTRYQRHISAAIAYNVWQYYQGTGDRDFLASFGAEIILNTALFWSEIAEFDQDKNRYVINGVVGPDEYHTQYPGSDEPGLNNNAYTNFMAVWNIQCALNLLEQIQGEQALMIAQKVGFDKETQERWEDITRRMFIPFADDGIILQFEGFGDLHELDWDKYKSKYGESIRLDRVLEKEGDSVNNYKASKQADVLMLFYLFSAGEIVEHFKKMGYEFKPEDIRANIRYYEKITSHGSTLSQVIHAWVTSRSNRKKSWSSFKKALLSDFQDVQGGTTPEGIHLGAMAGTVDIIQRC
ncbi:MAG TPA: glycoside hydrolase family 65 protein, partial [Mariniphaga sp.]|nr:glycoside hydrolase family 65 protein [Mariniphaga sp.]